MSTTAGQLIDEGNALLVDVVPDDSWLAWMNWALDDLEPHLCLEASGQVTLLADQTSVALPEDLAEGTLWRVECAGTRWPRQPFGSTKVPGYWLYANELCVPAAYGSDQQLTLYYERRPERLTSADDAVDMPATFDRLLMLAGLMRGKQQVPDLSSKVDFQAEYVGRMGALAQRAARLRSRRRPREFIVEHV